MGQLAREGIVAAAHGDEDGAIAANGAIWGFEYKVHPTSPNAIIQKDIDAFLSNTHDDGRGWAMGLVDPSQGIQAQILPSAALPTAPETSTWVMLTIGLLAMAGKIVHRNAVRA